jgi:transmembrane sensor
MFKLNRIKMEWHQIIKYLKNKCSTSEREEFETWLNTSEENQELYSNLKEIWENAEKVPDEIQVDFKKAWEKIELKAGIADKPAKHIPMKVSYKLLLRLAAVLVILISLGTLIKKLYFDNQIIITESNLTETQKELHLSDGTIVFLNRNSQLTYPESFKKDTREIKLDGEAFFKVAKDSLHPFIVYAGGTTTKVLGTSFNINVKDSSKVIVSVLEGKVALASESNQLKITKGEQGTFNKKTKQLIKSQITDENYLSWKTGILSFNNQKLGEAIKVLSEYYSKTIEVHPELQDRMITVTFNNQPLSEVLEILKMTLSIKIDSKPERILLSASNK